MHILVFFVLIITATSLTAQAPPNVVWLVMEDNSVHYLRLYAAAGAPMPRLEALAARGLTFENAYSQAPVCSVARSTLISGCYAPRIGAQYHRREREVPLPEGLEMFPAYLREAGYYTANNAKTDYNVRLTPGTWDDSSPRAHYRNRAPGQPFFYVRNFGTTHEGQLHFPAADLDRVATTDAPDDMPVFPIHPDDATFRYTRARYHELHRRVDAEIGQVLDELAADGLLDSTIVFVYGDHGGVLPGSKGYLYETGLHVPLVVYVPELYQHLSPYPAGSRPTPFARFMDFGPTVLQLAGLEVPEQMDGRPFLGKLPPAAPPRDTVYNYADRFDEKSDLVRAVRIGNFKYLRSYQPYLPDGLNNNYRYRMVAYRDWLEGFRAGRLDSLQARFFRPRPPEQLFDLAADPYETRNLVTDPAYADTLLQLRRALGEVADRLPDLSFIPESVFLREGAEHPVKYGQHNQQRLQRLRATADLQLLPFDAARPELINALADPDPLQRYWALTSCSAFGGAARELVGRAQQLAADDPDGLVRLRAVEFLGLLEVTDPRAALRQLLYAATSPPEAVAVLNTMSLFRFLHPDWEWSIDAQRLPVRWVAPGTDTPSNVGRLLAYLR